MLKYWQRRPESAEVREWLGDSAVKTCVFHRTTSDFEVFDTSRGDLGTHFGPLQLVNTLPRFEAADGEVMPGDRIIPAWLRMRRPLRLRDEGSFHADGIAIQLAQKGLLSMKQAREIFSECDANFRARKHHDPYLLALIKNAGYDGGSYLRGSAALPAARGEIGTEAPRPFVGGVFSPPLNRTTLAGDDPAPPPLRYLTPS